MIFDDPLKLVRALKGCPLSIRILLSIVHQPVSVKWLVRHSGYSPNTVTQALALLEDYQIVAGDTHRSNWTLTGNSVQLSLGMIQLEDPDRKKCDSDFLTPSSTT